MQLTPYSDLIKLKPEERDQRNAQSKINKQAKKCELKIAELDEQIASLEDAVVALCSKSDLDFDAIVDKQDELKLATRRREQFEDVRKQLFP